MKGRGFEELNFDIYKIHITKWKKKNAAAPAPMLRGSFAGGGSPANSDISVLVVSTVHDHWGQQLAGEVTFQSSLVAGQQRPTGITAASVLDQQ